MIFRNIGDFRMPALGLGTWQLQGEVGIDAVSYALEVGYRHIDTAVRYENEAEVGKAIAKAGLPRDELFVTTKVWHDSLTHDDVIASAERSLDRLGIDYVDLLLVHWPNPDIPLEETMAAMAELRSRGVARSIGVSNFTLPLLETVCETLGSPVVANQIEYHPYLDQSRILGYLRERGMVLEAYQPLAGGKVLSDPVIGEIAARHGRTPAQVTLNWLLAQEAVVAIPRSHNPKNIKGNFEVFDFTLSPEDHARIDALTGNRRFVDPSFAPDWDEA
ncbi:aldo/keto reductase [Salipiger abyssi]|uniref:aldo/keto reductase n=1 Tax=Salipiger abyssi TaxID=1250539 RepID=UPI004058EE50